MKLIGSNLEIPDTDASVIAVKAKYGTTHKIEAVLGVNPKLSKLQSNQSVVWGDGVSFHFRLTKWQNEN